MTAEELFPVTLTAPGLPVAGDRPVVFHGVNKSGSLAMEKVLGGGYYAAKRAHQYFSHYRGIPKHFEDLAPLMWHGTGHRFFVAHYIYGRLELPPDALLVTQVRHPLPRTLSVYGWMRRNHERRNEPLPPLDRWIRSTGGRKSTQMAQFASGWGEDARGMAARTPADTLLEMAIERLERDFAWFGVAELFEESIYCMAHICGLPAVLPWEKDTRNQWRQALDETDPAIVDLIQETFEHERRFYEYAVDLFKARIAEIDFGPSLEFYKGRCSGSYGERLLT